MKNLYFRDLWRINDKTIRGWAYPSTAKFAPRCRQVCSLSLCNRSLSFNSIKNKDVCVFTNGNISNIWIVKMETKLGITMNLETSLTICKHNYQLRNKAINLETILLSWKNQYLITTFPSSKLCFQVDSDVSKFILIFPS